MEKGTNGTPPRDRQNVSFKFTKKTSKTLSGNRLDEENTGKKTEKDYVISIIKSEIKSSVPEEQEKDLVVPLIKANNWRIPNASSNKSEDSENKIKEMAVQELLQETSEKNEQWENREFGREGMRDISVSIPLIMQNKIPEGYETDEKMDVSLRPDESKLEDYERVPVEKYGLAMLRGMGWKDGDPIGANSTKAVEPVQVQLRPKGLGLGADTSALKKVQDKKKDGEKLELVKGSYVCVIQGSHKGFYGQVLGLNEENARAIVKLSGKEKTITFPEFYLDVVSKKEYEKESKVINRASYEKYKKEREVKEKLDSNAKGKERHRDSKENKSGKEERKREYNSNSSDKHSKKRRHSQEKSVEAQSSGRHTSSKCWVRRQLRVRLIDNNYKKGVYFTKKLVVVDVIPPDHCICKTSYDKYLDGISSSMLETVIPRSEPAYVMIVKGKYSGEVCTILKKDKSKCMATVQLLSDRDRALKVDYDSICEYVGDITQFD